MPTETKTELADLKLTQKTIGGLNIKSVTESVPYLNMLVYGEPGIGKTRLGGSASEVPELSPVLVIDVEGGVLSLAKDYPNVDVVRIESWEDMNSVYSDLFDEPGRYNTVVLDSISEMQKFSMSRIMEAAVAKNPIREIEVPGMREWGINGEQIRMLVRAFRDMDINIILTAHVLEDKDETTSTIKYKPSLTGKLKNEIAGFMDIVGYMYKKRIKDEASGERYLGTFLLTSATDKEVAKDRSGKLPQVIENPTMAELFGYINGTLTESEQ